MLEWTESALMTHLLDGKRVLLGVSGGIAGYKSIDLVRRLRDAGAQVRVVMTAGAEAFVQPLSFQAVSGEPVRTVLLDPGAEAAMGHIELARWAQAVLVAPASADFIARISQGLAGDLLATLYLATEAPVAIAPSMNRVMWQHPATQRNVACLLHDGVRVFGPADGPQACGEIGPGRMLEPEQLVAALASVFAPPLLRGQRVLITAGPTREAIDPVRYISNHSSGRMGFAIASAAALAGAEVTLVAGPCALPTPLGVHRVDVWSAAEMERAVMARIAGQRVFIATAAVADYRPVTVAPHKIKKRHADLTLELARNPDILAAVAALSDPPFTVGFAAETQDLLSEARRKRDEKGVDMIAANLVGVPGLGFDADDNQLDVLVGEHCHRIGPGPKVRVASELVELIARVLPT
jgi:phosphopantothenoylcysteine decarboxylase / phosphopantothenate---cysteine ligase